MLRRRLSFVPTGHRASHGEFTEALRTALVRHGITYTSSFRGASAGRRWARRSAFGAALMAATDELSAPDDRTTRFRLGRPFPLLPAALGKAAMPAPFVTPERLASICSQWLIPGAG